jgi:hypothetical protein
MQDDTGRAALLLLGSFHMANPRRDFFSPWIDDVRTPARQAQLRAVVDGLKRFAPTKVALELAADAHEALDRDYVAYRVGTFELTPNERHQIGFRVAAELGHTQVYAVDWNEGQADLGDVFDYAKERQPEIYSTLMAWGDATVNGIQARLASGTIGVALRWANEPETLWRDHRIYLRLARIGEGKRYVGIEWVKEWYERNLKIYVNLARITAPGDRILVLYGAGHIPLLTQFAGDSGLYTLEPVERYLTA